MERYQVSYLGVIGVPAGGMGKISQESTHSSEMDAEGWVLILVILQEFVEWYGILDLCVLYLK